MKIIGGNRFALQGSEGETITVTVNSVGTVHLVTYIVEGGVVINAPSQGSMTQGVPLRFTLQKPAGGNRNNLNLGFTFATPAHAAGQPVTGPVEYDVAVKGSAPNSDVSLEFVSGAFGIPGDNRQWRFFID